MLHQSDYINLQAARGILEASENPALALDNKRAAQILNVISKAFSAHGCTAKEEHKLLVEIGVLPPLPDAPVTRKEFEDLKEEFSSLQRKLGFESH